MLESLRSVRNALPGFYGNDDPNQLVLGGKLYKVGDRVAYNYEIDRRDLASILRNVRRGKQFSDFCIFTNHGHEPGNWSLESPDYEQSFAREVIDAGADAYIAHGPHQLRGIEIYKGRPIFYSLGNFIMDDLRTPVGADMFERVGKDPRADTDADVTVIEMSREYDNDLPFSEPVFYESIVAVCKYEQNQLAEVRLHPIQLGHGKRFANRGVPEVASAAQAKPILDRLKLLSQPYGTNIEIVNGIGVITPELNSQN